MCENNTNKVIAADKSLADVLLDKAYAPNIEEDKPQDIAAVPCNPSETASCEKDKIDSDAANCNTAYTIESWMKEDLARRSPELMYLNEISQGLDLQLCKDKLSFPLKIKDGYVFLMVLDNTYPHITSDGLIPVKAYFVKPTLNDFFPLLNMKEFNFIERDEINYYISFENFKDVKECVDSNSLVASSVHVCLCNLVELIDKALKSNTAQKSSYGLPFDTDFINNDIIRRMGNSNISSKVPNVNPRCTEIILSDRAYMEIYKEAVSRFETETGGLLLGHYDNGKWYVVEASDPGYKGVFHVAFHQSDPDYANRVCAVISRLYKYPLQFLGMWHRHPGSLDTFSSTDNRTNLTYARTVNNGCISAIINFDPDFRLTFYYVEEPIPGAVKYTQIKTLVGDRYFRGNEDLMELDTIENDRRKNSRNGRKNG